MLEISQIQDHLLALQQPDGGWSTGAGRASSVEATAAVLLALDRPAQDPGAVQAAVAQGIGWLRRCQHHDGGWGWGMADPASGWHTAWAVWALSRVDPQDAAVASGIDWLLRVEPMRFAPDEEARFRLATGIDLGCRGWPWLPSQTAWVEPTALAMLALSATQRSPQIDAHLSSAVQFLQQRRCPGGGWNVGDPALFGPRLPARACPTAWAILALAAVALHALHEEDVQALEQDAAVDGGLQALAWTAFVLQTLHRPRARWIEQLSRLSSEALTSAQAYHVAIALLALREERP